MTKRISTGQTPETILVGGLSAPSAMPCRAWGIPAKYCKTGQELRKVKGSICEKCYACKGRFVFSTTKAAYERRYQIWFETQTPEWIYNMKEAVASVTTLLVPNFRIFDSGDSQSVEMTKAWIEVADGLPACNFWMSTREKDFLKEAIDARGGYLPKNLVVRISSPMIGQPIYYDEREFSNYRGKGLTSSCSMPRSMKGHWSELVKTNSYEFFYCMKPVQDDHCLDCRACWDKEVRMVCYLEH